MTNRAEVIAEPLEVYYQPWSGAEPTVPTTARTAAQIITDGWNRLGSRGVDGLARGGVRLALTREIQTWMGANEIKVGDAWPTAEEATVSFSVADVTQEVLALALDQSVQSVGGSPDYKRLGWGRPRDASVWSLLLRGRTPYQVAKDDDKWRQLLVWKAIVVNALELDHSIDAPTEVQFEFRALSLDGKTEVQKYGLIDCWTGA